MVLVPHQQAKEELTRTEMINMPNTSFDLKLSILNIAMILNRNDFEYRKKDILK